MTYVIRSLVLILLIFFIVLSLPLYASAAGSKDDYNIVFAIDTSGSMSYTDPDHMRQDAISLFLGLLPDQKCSVGCLTFNTDVVESCPLLSTEDITAKERIVKCVNESPDNGDTAIGIALSNALKILNVQQGKNEPHSAVIILTDGNDDYASSGYADEDYYRIKSNAIELAKECGVSVFTVAIDVNDSVNAKSLAEFSSYNSETVKISKASELKSAFQRIYSNLFSICLPNEYYDGGTTDPVYYSKSFIIPEIGIKDTNIVISSDRVSNENPISRIEFDGAVIHEETLSEFTETGRTISVTKIPNTYTGLCTVFYNNKIKDDEISVIYNDCLDIQLTGLSNDYSISKDINIYAKLFYDETVVSGVGYSDYIVNAIVFPPSDTTVLENGEKYLMTIQNNEQYYLSLPKDSLDVGQYAVSVVLNCKYTDKYLTTEKMCFSIINHNPVFIKHEITQSYTDNEYFDIDLSEIICDPDGEQLSFSSPGNKIIKENGTTLLRVAATNSRDKLKVIITAKDNHNGTTAGDLYIHLKLIGPIPKSMIVIIIVIAFLLMTALVLFCIYTIKPLKIEIEGTYQGIDTPITHPIRMFVLLRCFKIDKHNIKSGAYFRRKRDDVIFKYKKKENGTIKKYTETLSVGESKDIGANDTSLGKFIISVNRIEGKKNEKQ